ncbi:MAG: VanZ family protein [Leptolyngbyaceae cyanobacterium CSU_1_3]|nr:VanZ family protein [Leptolyngbyaceae cyanobacterium CSU_1_3]
MKKYPPIASQSLWILATVGFVGILFVILFFAYNGNLPAILTQNDKLAHFVLYGTGAFLGHRSCNRRHVRLIGYGLPLFPLLFALFTLGEELAQAFSPNRSLDALDLIASFIGIAIGSWLAQGKPKQPSKSGDNSIQK